MRCEAIHCFDRATVQFAIYPDGLDGARIIAEISENALRDVFGASGGGDSLLQACNNHFTAIGAKALDAYRADSQGPISLDTSDFATERSIIQPTGATTEASSSNASMAPDCPQPTPSMALA